MNLKVHKDLLVMWLILATGFTLGFHTPSLKKPSACGKVCVFEPGDLVKHKLDPDWHGVITRVNASGLDIRYLYKGKLDLGMGFEPAEWAHQEDQ